MSLNKDVASAYEFTTLTYMADSGSIGLSKTIDKKETTSDIYIYNNSCVNNKSAQN